MKRFLPLVLALFVSCGAILPPDPIAVRVSFYNEETEQTHTCTGVVTQITRVLTAEHCLSNEYAMFVNDKYAKVVRVKGDLALLETEPLVGIRITKIAKENSKIGDSVSTLGHAWSGPIIRLYRSVAGFVDGYMVLDGPLASGMSGGPVLNEDGELVGLNQGTNAVVGMVCPTEEIREFLK